MDGQLDPWFPFTSNDEAIREPNPQDLGDLLDHPEAERPHLHVGVGAIEPEPVAALQTSPSVHLPQRDRQRTERGGAGAELWPAKVAMF